MGKEKTPVEDLERWHRDMLACCLVTEMRAPEGDSYSRVAVSPVYPIRQSHKRSSPFKQDRQEESDYVWTRYNVGMTSGDFPLSPMHAIEYGRRLEEAGRAVLEIRSLERRIEDARKDARADKQDGSDQKPSSESHVVVREMTDGTTFILGVHNDESVAHRQAVSEQGSMSSVRVETFVGCEQVRVWTPPR